VGAESINRAIELNNVAVDFNKEAFLWGRRAAINPSAVERVSGADQVLDEPLDNLDAIIRWRSEYLTAYQNEAYAKRYTDLVTRAREKLGREGEELCMAIAKNHFKLLAYKDEYEVARLFSQTDWIDNIRSQFDGDIDIKFHMAPPALARKDTLTGHPLKRRFPAATLVVMGLLARLKFLRGTKLDVFGRNEERRMERQLIEDYEADVEMVIAGIKDSNRQFGLRLLQLPEVVKGYGHIKAGNIQRYRASRSQLTSKFQQPELTLVVNH